MRVLHSGVVALAFVRVVYPLQVDRHLRPYFEAKDFDLTLTERGVTVRSMSRDHGGQTDHVWTIPMSNIAAYR